MHTTKNAWMVVARADPLAEPFPAVFELSSLDGTTGFRLDGVDGHDWSGFSVATAGDMNGDGIDDLVIGALRADPGGRERAGSSYVVFGRSPAADCRADLDGDGSLTIFDFLAFSNAFDLGCP